MTNVERSFTLVLIPDTGHNSLPPFIVQPSVLVNSIIRSVWDSDGVSSSYSHQPTRQQHSLPLSRSYYSISSQGGCLPTQIFHPSFLNLSIFLSATKFPSLSQREGFIRRGKLPNEFHPPSPLQLPGGLPKYHQRAVQPDQIRLSRHGRDDADVSADAILSVHSKQ